eukprot:TRINITY_DN11369_c0_g1_i2.p1 TRINITY_DN11369_c0_g1~~TRINITY_DN11369_c0_g1_i2.p1  ORF type:complete len:212 (-),score=27.25 TRINITY_DN11369_c0_g1_i2:609-1244(-)
MNPVHTCFPRDATVLPPPEHAHNALQTGDTFLGSVIQPSFHLQNIIGLETMLLDTEPLKAAGIAGKLRMVSPADKVLLGLLAQWFQNFERDLGNEVYSLDGPTKLKDDMAAAAGRKDLYVWEVKDKPVAMVMAGRTRPKQLLCVYTVPHQRGRGYGQAATAAVCTEKRGVFGPDEPIMLNADSKFGAQRVYERVGFKFDGYLHGVTFDAWF